MGTRGGPVDHDTIETLRDRHPAWRLLRAQHAPLVLSFLGSHFVDGNHGATPETQLVDALDDHLHALDVEVAVGQQHAVPLAGAGRGW